MTPPRWSHNPPKQRRQHRLRHAYQTLHHIIDKLTHSLSGHITSNASSGILTHQRYNHLVSSKNALFNKCAELFSPSSRLRRKLVYIPAEEWWRKGWYKYMNEGLLLRSDYGDIKCFEKREQGWQENTIPRFHQSSNSSWLRPSQGVE